MDTLSNLISGRPAGYIRWRDAGLGALLAAAGVKSTLAAQALGPILLVVAVFLLAGLRRRVDLTDETLVAQGRFTRREVPLRDLAAVGVSPVERAWVAPREGRPFYLYAVGGRHIATHSGPEFAAEIRRRAIAAGADLREEPGERSSPESPAPLFGM